MPRYRKPTLREQIQTNADVARGYGEDRDKLWHAALAALPMLAPGTLRDEIVNTLRATARCSCGNRTSFDPLNPPPYGTTCERCLSS